jgi:hypothetical protein
MPTRKKRIGAPVKEAPPIPIVLFKNSLRAWYNRQKAQHAAPALNPGKANNPVEPG